MSETKSLEPWRPMQQAERDKIRETFNAQRSSGLTEDEARAAVLLELGPWAWRRGLTENQVSETCWVAERLR